MTSAFLKELVSNNESIIKYLKDIGFDITSKSDMLWYNALQFYRKWNFEYIPNFMDIKYDFMHDRKSYILKLINLSMNIHKLKKVKYDNMFYDKIDKYNNPQSTITYV